MRVMTVFDHLPRVLAVVTIPRGKTLNEVFNRWFKSEQNNNFVCEEDLTPEELTVINYKELTIEGEEDDA